MRLLGVFCLKAGEICILISWPLVPNSKVNSNVLLNLVTARSYFVIPHSVISEEALGEILLFLFIHLEFKLTAFWI